MLETTFNIELDPDNNVLVKVFIKGVKGAYYVASNDLINFLRSVVQPISRAQIDASEYTPGIRKESIRFVEVKHPGGVICEHWSGTRAIAEPGDYIISKDGSFLDIVSKETFEKQFIKDTEK